MFVCVSRNISRPSLLVGLLMDVFQLRSSLFILAENGEKIPVQSMNMVE